MKTRLQMTPPAAAQDLTLLVVDDDEFEVHLTSTVLGEALPHACVVAVTDPTKALGVIRAGEADCVLIDYNMPKLDGIELGRQIRAEFPYLPLVLMTGVGYDTLVMDALRGGFTDYIPKDKISCESAQRTISRAIEAVAQTRLIEEQRQELEHFAYALAHDFKQPIRQIRVFADLLCEELKNEESAPALTHLGFLSDASKRLSALVDVMSQYTLVNKAPELGVVEIGEVVAGVRQGLEEFIAERNGILLAEATARAHGNEALMTQVLQNLVVNGLRYNESRRPRVSIRAETSGDGKCRIIVSDNGIGIESRYIDEIFRPLVRLHTSAEYPGTGLGLSITRKAVLAQGGRIWCQSALGQGSEFTVELNASAPDFPSNDEAG